MIAAQELVTVIIPAFDAAATIDETLRSARAQTHANLEILVVDDGSHDETIAIVEKHMADDGRIKLIRQSNLGVAAARNRAIQESRAQLIAPLDADDIWHPQKIEKQLNAMRTGGEKVGLVYSWSLSIDRRGRVIGYRHRPTAEGNIYSQLCKVNLVGNGSTPLMRKSAVLEFGGYDPSLRARGAQGCEDIKLYLQIARKYEFAVVKEHLTGYRRVRGNMSSDWQQMYKSFDLVASEFEAQFPETAEDFYEGRNYMLRFLLIRSMKDFRLQKSLAILRRMFAYDRNYAVNTLLRIPYLVLKNVTTWGIVAPFDFPLARPHSFPPHGPEQSLTTQAVRKAAL